MHDFKVAWLKVGLALDKIIAKSKPQTFKKWWTRLFGQIFLLERNNMFSVGYKIFLNFKKRIMTC